MFGQQVMDGVIALIECSTVGLCGPVDNPIANGDHPAADELLETAAFELNAILESSKAVAEIEAVKPTTEIALEAKQTSPSPQSMSSLSFDSGASHDSDFTSEPQTSREPPEETVQKDKISSRLPSSTKPFDEKSLVVSERPFDEFSTVRPDETEKVKWVSTAS
jgi:hypothetical protein